MKPKILFCVCCLSVAVLGCPKKEMPAQLPPPEIPVFVTKAQKVPLYKEFVGQIFGLKDIAIRARLEGFLEGVHFAEGSEVKADTLLYTLESQPYEAEVAAKMSGVAEAKTMLAKATSDLNRIRPLAQRRAVSQSDLDSAVAQFEAAGAAVEAAQANLRVARIKLGYTKIYSPIDGIIGKTKAKVGDFVGRSPNPVILNVVSNIDTILVQFFLTENQYLLLARRYLGSKSSSEERDREQGLDQAQQLKFDLILADGSLYDQQGKFDFLDREIDPTTGAILVQASFLNPQKILRPGQFAKVRIMVEEIPDAILVPQRCVKELQGQHFVNVVRDNNQVEEKQVTVGPTVENFWLIQKGLQAGEKVVYEGLQKIKDGATVKPIIQEITTPFTNGQ